ncbi:hypothetical protein [Alloacidobacterium sp.]|uniref:hypothetical protein n=1 Tax=Alloacidobacterium sp. TaxID=2951999 RepID=UPI002D4CCC55|nr:hypothetical protein [Alloacidobacterium sp.]HYK34924.1 hypothetical protein [Alloacidobacterium sp.]
MLPQANAQVEDRSESLSTAKRTLFARPKNLVKPQTTSKSRNQHIPKEIKAAEDWRVI